MQRPKAKSPLLRAMRDRAAAGLIPPIDELDHVFGHKDVTPLPPPGLHAPPIDRRGREDPPAGRRDTQRPEASKRTPIVMPPHLEENPYAEEVHRTATVCPGTRSIDFTLSDSDDDEHSGHAPSFCCSGQQGLCESVPWVCDASGSKRTVHATAAAEKAARRVLQDGSDEDEDDDARRQIANSHVVTSASRHRRLAQRMKGANARRTVWTDPRHSNPGTRVKKACDAFKGSVSGMTAKTSAVNMVASDSESEREIEATATQAVTQWEISLPKKQQAMLAHRYNLHDWVRTADESSDEEIVLKGVETGWVVEKANTAPKLSPRHVGPELRPKVTDSPSSVSLNRNVCQSMPNGARQLWVITFPCSAEDHDVEFKYILHHLDAEQGKAFVADPPITNEGAERASQLAAFLQETGGLEKIYVSPYLRSLQIAQHIGWATQRMLCMERGLGNGLSTKSRLPSAQERFMNFPSIDLRHRSFSRDPCAENQELQSLPRILDVGLDIVGGLGPGQRVAVVTHSVSGMYLVAGLVSGCKRSRLPQDPQRLKDMWDCLQRIEYGHMCGTYLLEFNEASQRWESDLKCHTVHRKVEMGAKMKQSAVDGRQRKHASKHNATFSRLLGCAQGWESKWAALCKQHQVQMAQ